MADENVITPSQASPVASAAAAGGDGHKRKLEDFEHSDAPEAVTESENNSDRDALNGSQEEGNGDVDESEAKRPRLESNGDNVGEADDSAPQNGHAEEEKEDEPKEETEDERKEESKQPESEDNNGESLEGQEPVEEPPETIAEEAAPNDNEKTDVGRAEEPRQPNAESEEEASHLPREGDVPVESADRQPGSDSILSRKMEVPNDKVGVLIGKARDTIRSLQDNSGAKIQIVRDADADPRAASRPLELVGTLESINRAERLIKDVIAEAGAGGSPSLVARGFSTVQAASGGEQLEIQVPVEIQHCSGCQEELDSSSKSRKRRRHKDVDREEKRRSKKSRRDVEKNKKKKKHSKRERKKHKRRERRKMRYDSEDGSGSGSDSESESPESVLLRMIDEGQAVDIRELSERSLVKHLRRLFIFLNLKENGDKIFLLPDKASPTLDIVGPIILSHIQPHKELQHLESHEEAKSVPPVPEMEPGTKNVDDRNEDSVGPRRRVIGPEMPSADLLAAAAKLSEAEAELREAELDGDDGQFIGPPPPAMVKEAESANEAERFEEITRIIGAEADSPYDIVGANKDMAAENIKKRYWKLSLMVHPDKSSHPQAHQAFVKLNKAFKDLQDPEKRKALDDKLKEKEEREAFQVELKAMREAAQWRRLQGISMEGDDLLLAEMDAKAPPKRDEWMTTLPLERKPGNGMNMHSTRFSKTGKEGRGDTSVWTDTPSERAQKAKMNYLEAYNEAAALASNEQENTKKSADAELVDQYNKTKRSKSLVEKHMESAKSRSRKKSKQGKLEPVNEDWEGKHPWKPWDREKDLTAGRQSVNLDADNMAQGLTSRFSSGSFQRNFL